jgi:16S rRNA (adenine1518-N6/adenine1519-N6)-dimethyltransferase
VAKHTARKRFGQNFLTDSSVIEAIVQAIAPVKTDHLFEIGPGLGALTIPILERIDHLNVIEIDRDLAARLSHRFKPEQLTLIEQDALRVDFSTLAKEIGHPIRIVGNLPYNISSPMLFACAAHADHIVDQFFMLQREVVDRIVAAPDTTHYSRLSVMLQYRYTAEKLFDVSPEAFDPPPRVVSSVVRMVPLTQTRPRAKNDQLFAEVVQKAFAQRRKMLRGALGAWAKKMPWQAVGVEPTWRAEQVSIQGFINMADALSEMSTTPETLSSETTT